VQEAFKVTHRFGGSAIKGVPKEIKLSFANLPISVGIAHLHVVQQTVTGKQIGN